MNERVWREERARVRHEWEGRGSAAQRCDCDCVGGEVKSVPGARPLAPLNELNVLPEPRRPLPCLPQEDSSKEITSRKKKFPDSFISF